MAHVADISVSAAHDGVFYEASVRAVVYKRFVYILCITNMAERSKYLKMWCG